MAIDFGFEPTRKTSGFIFISYAHKDADIVAPYVAELNRQGFDVWYDRGINALESFKSVILERIAQSACFIAFISQNYALSPNCITETSWATNKGIPRLPVFIEKMNKLPSELTYDIMNVQYLNAYEYGYSTSVGMISARAKKILSGEATDWSDWDTDRNPRRAAERTSSSYSAAGSAGTSFSRESPAYQTTQVGAFNTGQSGKSPASIGIIALCSIAGIALLIWLISSMGGGGEAQSNTGYTPQNSYSSGNVYESADDNTYDNTNDDSYDSSQNNAYDPPVVSRKYYVGDTFTMGSFNQDNNSSNGQEDIEWMVLDADDEKALVLSVKTLDIRSFHNTRQYGDTWESCDLREWMNGSFYRSAFNSSEQNCILTTTVYNDENPDYGTYSGSDTTDKIFLLSVDEAELYLSQNQRNAKPTRYIKDKGGWNTDTCWWWLRTAGDSNKKAVYVDEFGNIGYKGNYINDEICVRPAMYIQNY